MNSPVRVIFGLFPRRKPLPALEGLRSRSVWGWLSRRSPVIASTLAWATALVFAAWIVSGWVWVTVAPDTTYYSTAHETDPVVVAQSVAAKHLMGVSKSQSPDQGGVRQGSFRLLGLMTASERWPGFAILSQDGKESLVVMEGEEIMSGVSLMKVMSDKVVIGRDGSTESLALTQP